VLQSPAALTHVFAHLRSGAAVAAIGGKWPPHLERGAGYHCLFSLLGVLEWFTGVADGQVSAARAQLGDLQVGDEPAQQPPWLVEADEVAD
jgi:hypothetical protein